MLIHNEYSVVKLLLLKEWMQMVEKHFKVLFTISITYDDGNALVRSAFWRKPVTAWLNIRSISVFKDIIFIQYTPKSDSVIWRCIADSRFGYRWAIG